MKNSINNWFKKNTKEEEKIFRQGLLAFLIFIIVVILLKVFRLGIFFGKGERTMKVITASTIGNLISAHIEGDEKKFLAYANFICRCI